MIGDLLICKFLRINAEKEKQLKEERERNLDRIASETKQQSLRVAILDDSKKVLESEAVFFHLLLSDSCLINVFQICCRKLRSTRSR